MRIMAMMRSDPADTGQRVGASVPANAWMSLERAEKLPEILARLILRQITQSEMAPGERLPPEAQMVAQFGAGRASLREALRILEIHGIIRIKAGPKGGPRVTELSASQFGQTTTMYLQRTGATFEELIEARLVIEPVMARLAAERLTDLNAERLRSATARGWEAIDAPANVWSEATEQFHAVVAGASGNKVLDLHASSLISIERQRLGPMFAAREDREQILKVHDRIASAILRTDGDAAESLARKHIQADLRVMSSLIAAELARLIEWR
jgi:GntR family transcriptional regulator, transcriptional repressor for pyruvate dehydrogenase complex